MILNFHGHHRYNCEHADPDDSIGCCICEGGLFSCTRCGGAEGSLPTDCPGIQISHEMQDDIAAGNADYLWREGWVLLDANGNPCDAGTLLGD